MSPPLVAITMGDPAGIGPEVVLKAIVAPAVRRVLRPLLFGDLGVFRDTAKRLGLKVDFVPLPPDAHHPYDIALIGELARSRVRGARPPRRDAVALCETSQLSVRDRALGRPRIAGGAAAYEAIVAGMDAVQGGVAAALVTAPISKANLAAAGYRFSGHTELLAHRTGARRVRMMMAGPQLRVVLATTHVALRRVPVLLTPQLVFDTIAVTHAALQRWFGISRPRIAVCGLNPHAGEAGLFGREDEETIRPAVQRARRRGILAQGPLPSDSVFAQVIRGSHDAVVCMYHDQGLGAFKLLHFEDGVNVTLDLPFVRTSPDHGTAYDIAGRGCASPGSMIAAATLAARLCDSSRELRRG